MDDLVAMNDVLMAMADSVMESQPKPFNPSLKFQDKKIDFKIGGKPPREIFYRKTVTFMTKLPPPVQRKLCSCKYICDGDIATIKCHSCSIYDPAGQSFYCNACFHSRHPWYRVNHIHTAIIRDESIEHTLKIAHRMAEAKRYEKEGVDLLSGLRNQLPALQYIADDEKVDNQLRVYGRRMIALEEHIERLRDYIKEDIQASEQRKSLVKPPPPLLTLPTSALLTAPSIPLTIASTPANLQSLSLLPTPSPSPSPHAVALPAAPHTTAETAAAKEEAALSTIPIVPIVPEIHHHHVRGFTKLQACYRRWIGQRIVSSLVLSRTVKVWSPDDGRDFYYDRITGVSSWTPSKFLRPEHIDHLEYLPTDTTTSSSSSSLVEYRHIWYCKKYAPSNNRSKRKKAMKRKTATRIIQGFGRCLLARYKIICQANTRYRRILDDESGVFYYANVLTGESAWEKPHIYLSLEPPVYLPSQQQEQEQLASGPEEHNHQSAESARYHGRVKRSPRVNRIHTSDD